jgi:hypothetical protein
MNSRLSNSNPAAKSDYELPSGDINNDSNQDLISDTLTIDELLAGQLDIESGIEEAVKAACEISTKILNI